MNIGIVGCGWLGSRIAEKFSVDNNIFTTTTSNAKIAPLHLKGFNPTLVDLDIGFLQNDNLPWNVISTLDVLIITVPFSSRKKEAVGVVHKRMQNILQFIGDFKGQMFFTSTTSVYPDAQKCYTEDDVFIEQNSAEYFFKSHYPQVNLLRLGGLMGDNRILSNYKVLNLDAPVNHVHFEDIILIMKKMIAQKFHSTLLNVVAPHHPSKREVICLQKNIPFVAKDKENGKVVSSKKLINTLEYDFKYADPRFFHL